MTFVIQCCYAVLYVQEAFAKYVDVNSVAESLAAPKAARLTPKAFMHSITQKCQANPQHIVLPEVHITPPKLHLVLTLDDIQPQAQS